MLIYIVVRNDLVVASTNSSEFIFERPVLFWFWSLSFGQLDHEETDQCFYGVTCNWRSSVLANQKGNSWRLPERLSRVSSVGGGWAKLDGSSTKLLRGKVLWRHYCTPCTVQRRGSHLVWTIDILFTAYLFKPIPLDSWRHPESQPPGYLALGCDHIPI